MISSRFFEEVFVKKIYAPVEKLGNLETVIDLGATTGEFSLWIYPQAGKIHAIFLDENQIGRVDCLKIDVESAEKEIFAASDISLALSRIGYIIGEHLTEQDSLLKNNGFSFESYEYGYIAKKNNEYNYC